jgi:DNA-binding transcriptional regulator YiaG
MFTVIHTMCMEGLAAPKDIGVDEQGAEILAARLAFGSEVRRLRRLANLSQATLARSLGYSRSYLSKMETGQVEPTRHFAGRADEVPAARGAIMRGWRTFDNRRDQNRASTGLEPVPAANWRDAGKGSAGDSPVKMIPEWTRLRYDAGAYHIAVMREIENLDEDVLDEYHRSHRLRWSELNFRCWSGGSAGDFALGLGHELEYDLLTSTDQLIEGRVEHLGVELWGRKIPLGRRTEPLGSAISMTSGQGRTIWSWSTDTPRPGDRYRFEWRFGNPSSEREE